MVLLESWNHLKIHSIGGFSETVKHKIKKQKGRFLDMLLGTLGASILGNLLTKSGVLKAGSGYNVDKKF